MKKFALNKIKVFQPLALLLMLAIPFVAPNLNTSAASIIDSNPTPIQYLTSRWVNAVTKCTLQLKDDGGSALKDSLSTAERNSMLIFNSGSGDTGRLTVGHDLEYGGGLEGNDGVASCEELILPSIEYISEAFGSVTAFVDFFYTPGPSGSVFYLKDDGSTFGSQIDTYANQILQKNFVSDSDKGDIRKARLSVAFAECFKESTTGSTDTPDLSSKYVYVSGKDSNSNIPVGLGEPGGVSEKLNCSTLANLADKSQEDLLGFMQKYNVTTGVLRNNPQNIYANIRADGLTEVSLSGARTGVLTVLTAHPDKVSFCLTSAGLPNTIGLSSITEWLITGNSKDNLIYTGAGSGVSATDTQANNLKSCLLDDAALGTELVPILASLKSNLEVIDADSANNTGSSSESTDSDVCLSKGDNFISWAACPLINLLNDAFDKIKGTLQDMLKFSIEDSGDGTVANTNELKNSWNIFRGIASILIIIFFLTALLVKSIKGE